MEISKSIFQIPNILMVLFAFIYVITDLVQMPTLIGNMLVALVGLCSFFYVFVKRRKTWVVERVTLYAILLTFCMIISILYNNNANITNILWIWGYLGIALVLWICRLSSTALFGIYYSVALIFLIYALQGRNPQEVLSSGSGNNISTIVMYFMLVAYLNKYKKQCPLPYTPALVFIIISLWGNGRAGLLTSLLFFLLIFLYNFIYMKKGKPKTLIILFIILMFGGYFINHFFSAAILQYQYKMERYGMDSVRTEIWKEYLQGTLSNIGNFFFGVSTKDTVYPKLSYYGGNTHNAFLMLHSKFGIIGLMIFMINTVLAGVKSLKTKDYVFFNTISVVVFRSFFDWTAFPGIFDIFFWIMIIYVGDKKTRDNI
ncbi:hypothetical protein [Holdemania filiformis]|uniref:hypothetical protein n=1 Tax=Holdemania filiformis TaxID=61171 RepID=UPI002432B851|nr:hypothetical protein [Holdemania filiformis]